MAQGPVMSMMTQRGSRNGEGPSNGALVSSLPDDKVGEIGQYEKLLRFCDDVSRGTHPRIKPKKPAQETGSSSLPRATNSVLPTKPQDTNANLSKERNQRVVENSLSFQANSQHASVSPYPSLPGLKTLSGAAGDQSKAGSGKVEFNPVLLEKSDDLKRAEMKLQRQRIEQALKEQLDHRRAAQKLDSAAAAEDELDGLDIMDVLTRALAVVQKTPAAPIDDITANIDASSDSFDDNTFYSSQHDTPQSQQLSRLPDDVEDEHMRDASPYEPEFEPEPATIPSQGRDAAGPGLFPGTNLPSHDGVAPSISTPSSILPHGPNILPGLASEATSVSRAFRQVHNQEGFSSQGSGPASQSEESLNTGPVGAADSRDLARVNEQLLDRALHPDNSPVIRAHDLSPVAPQPAHVSPLAVNRQQQLALSDSSGPRGTPAQVAALRKQPSAATSPESSPQGTRAEKKKNKKKKRKADKLAAETAAAASPYIKPEPQSPSPLSAQPYIRPAKRQRQQHQRLSAQHDPRFDHAIVVDDNYGERYPARSYRDDRDAEYRRGNEAPRQETEPAQTYYPRVERVYYDDSRLPPGPRQGAPSSPGGRPMAYVPHEVRGRRSVSNVIEGAFGEPTTYLREAPAVARVSTRPTGYRERSRSPVAYQQVVGAMGPPGPSMIIVDRFGREYEPPRPRSEQRPVDSELLYGRPPHSRAISRIPDPYEDETRAYRPVEGAYPAPRRVVTHPELAGLEPRDYREHGYATHVMPPPAGEYLPPRARADTRGALEPAREYIARPPSVRPLPEQGRYDGPTVAYDRRPPDDYYPIRATSVRPPEGTRYEIPVAYERRVGGEEPFYEYTAIRSASVRPAEPIRYEVARDYPGTRVASVRPEISMGAEYVNAPPPARAFSVHPGEGAPSQYMRPSVPGAVPSTERYYGRPPVQNDDEVVYLDRHPREVFRQMR